MFTENEIGALILDSKIKEATEKLREEFIEKEAPFLEISVHDFLSLIMITPSVGVALANNSVSLMEEMALNKKARKYSKGGYFLKQDPVVNAMKYLIKHYDVWSEIFYDHIKNLIGMMLNKDELMKSKVDSEDVTDEQYCVELLKAPFILVRFISSFLSSSEDEDLSIERKIGKNEYDRTVEILEKVDLINIPLVKRHLVKLVVK
ncbi:MAG: hypothetical protein DRI71_11940 [Bacteroidetes bacterium]|nr:MAG: hypothetical protein DRI71_11940 [Bacteroidota bacterium]